MQTVFLVGPTAVGKSAVALELARRLNAEIVSADSMQVYRGMDIGTAKATREEQKLVRHHLLDICEVNETFDAKRFVDLATNAITAIHQRGKPALVVGGTGLYIRALRRGLFAGPGRDEKLRAKLEMMPTETLGAELERVDPLTASKIDRKNRRRLVRALEVFVATGRPLAEMQKEWVRGSEFRVQSSQIGFCLNREREDLRARIDRRIDEQIAAGWVEEVRRLVAAIPCLDVTIVTSKHGILQAAGYRELAAHLRGEMTLPEAVALIKTRTRQLAKRQLTWFRREPDLIWVAMGQAETAAVVADRIQGMLEGGHEQPA